MWDIFDSGTKKIHLAQVQVDLDKDYSEIYFTNRVNKL
jgi:hypothetical protein